MNNNTLNHFIEQLNNRGYTSFLNPLEYKKIKGKVCLKKYNIYYMYKNSTKLILYTKNIPHITLCKIVSSNYLTHPSILREMFNLGIKEEMYGDIIINNNEAYIFLLSQIKDYFIYNFKSHSTDKIIIEEVPLETLKDYEMKFEKLLITVSSIRIDNVISNLISTSRKEILTKFKDKEVVLNYEIHTKYTTTLKEGDVFSIRKFGKYRYEGIIKQNKKGNYIIKISKYS